MDGNVVNGNIMGLARLRILRWTHNRDGHYPP